MVSVSKALAGHHAIVELHREQRDRQRQQPDEHAEEPGIAKPNAKGLARVSQRLGADGVRAVGDQFASQYTLNAHLLVQTNK